MEPISLALGLAQATGLVDKVGRWFAGDNGADVANKVVDVAKAVTGESNPQKAHDKIMNDPELQLRFEEAILDKEQELERLAYQDKANARAMQTAALNQKDKFAKRFVYYLAAFWSVVATVYLMCITFVQIPEASVRFADTILGFVLGTVIASIIGFFFGSSAVTNEQHEQMSARDSPAFK
ncbi:hypothetical protein HJ009_22575 [Vibrio parahaemolyticus]|nr:hypothetical protein [Vibrio parahaemolyticus]